MDAVGRGSEMVYAALQRRCGWALTFSGFLGVFGAMACASSPARREPVEVREANQVPRVIEEEALPDARWQRVILSEQGLSLPLPDRGGWRSLGRRGAWSGLVHAGSETELWVRHSQARRSVTREECEQEAQSSLALLREPREQMVEERLLAPSDYFGAVQVSLLAPDRGLVLAVGAGTNRCYTGVFVSRSERDLPARLFLATSRILSQVERSGATTGLPRGELLGGDR